jgi:hypothetical protein
VVVGLSRESEHRVLTHYVFAPENERIFQISPLQTELRRLEIPERVWMDELRDHRRVHSSFREQPMNKTNRSTCMKREIELSVEELEQRIAPAIVLTNPGGNTPSSDNAANGEAIDYLNPAGKAPGGWNK